MKFHVIGAGRLGKNIALALSSAGLGTLVAVCNQTLVSAQRTCDQLGFGLPVAQVRDLPLVDVIWITCNDDAIASVVAELNQISTFTPGTLVIHCSGVMNTSILKPLQDKGCHVASFHPMKAFRADYLSADAFAGVECVIEGDDVACSWLKSAFDALGAEVSIIASSAKTTYHAAACLVANYVITLSACAEELLFESGLDANKARRVINSLIQGALTNLEQTQSSAKSLSGPLLRGDLSTLQKHLAAIDNESIRNLYKAAGLATLAHTQLSEEKQAEIAEILS